jgi:hypothetical protein
MLTCRLTEKRLIIEVDSGGENADLELWTAERRADALARLLARPVDLRRRRSKASSVTRRVRPAV